MKGFYSKKLSINALWSQWGWWRERTGIVVLTAWGTLLPCCGQEKQGETPSIVVPYAEVKPQLKADLSDLAWNKAVLIKKMSHPTQSPRPETALPETTVGLLWDESFLYIRFFCRDEEQYTVNKGRDAKLYEGDVVEVFLDTAGDAKEYYELQVSPRNDLFDTRFRVEVEPKSEPNGVLLWDILMKHHRRDLSWNYRNLISTVGQANPGRSWVVDIAIPAPDIGLAKGFRPGKMKANFLRYDWPLIEGKRQLVPQNWSPVIYGRPHVSPQAMGSLILEKKP